MVIVITIIVVLIISRSVFLSRQKNKLLKLRISNIEIPWDVFEITSAYDDASGCINNIYYPEFRSHKYSYHTIIFGYEGYHGGYSTRKEAEYVIKELIYMVNYYPNSKMVDANLSNINRYIKKLKGLC